MMTRNEIIDLYDKGFSIDYIVNEYFKKENKNYSNYYENGNYVINKSKITKNEARRNVEYILLPYIKVINKK